MEYDIYVMRMFAVADCSATANVIANKYIDQLSDYCEIKVESLERYWKIATYFEILMTVSIPTNKRKFFQELLNAIGGEFTKQREGEYIWNSEAGSVFKIIETKWLHLEIAAKAATKRSEGVEP